jgi:competence protein ComEA
MMTPGERKAVRFLAAVAALGIGLRFTDARRATRALAAGESRARNAQDTSRALADALLERQRTAVDSALRTRAPKPQRRASTPRSSSVGDASIPSTRRRPREDSTERRPVNVNRATAKELERLPRIGPSLAQRIVAWRDAHGPFRSVDDLRHVRGIGPVTARSLAPAVTF